MTEEDRKRRILDAICEVRDQFDAEKDDEGYDLCDDLLARIQGWCAPGAKIEWPYK